MVLGIVIVVETSTPECMQTVVVCRVFLFFSETRGAWDCGFGAEKGREGKERVALQYLGADLAEAQAMKYYL
eukprot:1158964-Pelagomonas_calceolata.AAC.6